MSERIHATKLFLERKQKRVEAARQSTVKAREELAACVSVQEKEEALLADGEQRLVQLLLEEKKNPSPFRSPPPPPVVADAKAELLRMQTVIDDLQRELVRYRGGPLVDSTAKDDDSMGLVAVSEPMTASAKMLGLIDEASSKRPRVAVGVGASASKGRVNICSARIAGSRSRFNPEGSQERSPVEIRVPRHDEED